MVVVSVMLAEAVATILEPDFLVVEPLIACMAASITTVDTVDGTVLTNAVGDVEVSVTGM